MLYLLKLSELFSMFKDYPHNVEIAYINNKKCVIKTLKDSDILKREYSVMKFIEPFNVSPKIYEFKDNKIIEEYIDGESLFNVDNKLIIELADRIDLFHKLKLSKGMKEALKDDYTHNDKYQPLKLFQFITSNIASCVDYEKLNHLFIMYEKYLENINYKMGLVHGDLTPNNIILNKKGIFIIDWTDSRYDILSCDISQLFYAFNLSEQQKQLFLERYQANYVDNTILEMHNLLLLLFDLSDIFRKEGRVDDKIIEAIERIIK